ncbi:MAG: transcription antitermination factor NusB [Zavarzinella sp.]
MTRRSRAREVVLQLLFQWDLNRAVREESIHQFIHERLKNGEAEQFCLELYQGVIDHQSKIDALISQSSENWKIQRMAPTDRNVLRMGTYEMEFAPTKTPAPVALDEAIELSRRYGSADSSSFVNGVLDKIYQHLTGESLAKAAQAAVPPADVVPETTEPDAPPSDAAE